MTVTTSYKYAPILSLLFVSFLWGTTFPGGKYVLETLPLFFYMAVRFILATLVLLPLSWSQLKTSTPRDWKIACLIGLILYVTLVLQTVALLYTTAAKNAFVFGAYVVLVPVLSFIVFKQRMTLKASIACIAAFIGLGFIAGEEGMKGGLDLGVVLTLISALFMAMQIVSVGRYASEVAPLVITFFLTLTGAVLFVVSSLVIDGLPGLKSFEIAGLSVWGCIVFMAVFSTSLSYAMQCSAQKHVDQSVAGIILSMCCVFGAFQSWLFLDETFSLEMIIGGFIIVCSILIAQIPERSIKAFTGRIKSKRR